VLYLRKFGGGGGHGEVSNRITKKVYKAEIYFPTNKTYA
jgi:hypothetical protein